MKKLILTLSLLVCAMVSANSLFAAGGIKFGMPAGPLGCWGYGICEITWVTAPDAVTASFSLSSDGSGALVMAISKDDMIHKCPEHLPHFDEASGTVDFPNEYVATDDFNSAIGATIVIHPGVYSFTLDDMNNYVVVIPQAPTPAP